MMRNPVQHMLAVNPRFKQLLRFGNATRSFTPIDSAPICHAIALNDFSCTCHNANDISQVIFILHIIVRNRRQGLEHFPIIKNIRTVLIS